MQANNQNQRGASRKKANSKTAKASKPKQPKQSSPKTKSVGAAEFRDNSKTVGMKDLLCHRVSWIAGYTYVGNGTLGATDSVYFADNSQANIVSAANGGAQVPVLGSDAGIGKSYVSDIEKHYSRKVVRRARLRLESLSPATSNSMMAVVAPIRGCGASGDTTTTTGTTAAPSISNVIGMDGAKSCASYERLEIDLTPYIAGGSGSKQNEFTINRDGDTAGSAWGSGTVDLVGIAPCAFVVGGTNSTAGLRATFVHMVIIDTWCDYLDFIAGMSNPNPLSLVLTKEEASQILRMILVSPDKDARNSPLCRTLVRMLGSGSIATAGQ